MGDCQSKNKIDDVHQPTIELTVNHSNESTKEPIKEAEKPKDEHDPVAGSVEEIPMKQKPENGTSFGQNKRFYFSYPKIYSGDKREIISIHIGQAGVQIGNSCWELFCLGLSFTSK